MRVKSRPEGISFTIEEIAAERNRLLIRKNRCHTVGHAGSILAVLLLGIVFGWHLPRWTRQTDWSMDNMISDQISSSEEDNSSDTESIDDLQVSQMITEGDESSGSTDDAINGNVGESSLSGSDDVKEEDVNSEGVTGTVDVKTYLNVRSGSGLDCDIIGALLPGAQVTVIEEKDGWYRVEISEVIGYVFGEYLEVEDP